MAENNNCPDCLYKAFPAKNLDKNELVLLQQNSVEVVFDKKDTIFKQGALSSNIIYLKTGMVKLIIRGPQREQILKLKKGDKVLFPSFICRDLLASAHAIGVIPVFYEVNLSLKPINLPESIDVRAVLAVNYFGFAQDLTLFKNYCHKEEISLFKKNR